ncbi:MAG TPA: pantoate--beta-alanine ligase [Sphingomicrobium sp.]|nr:pantoate--beta-alanine ligase [Sphingomicrobium sp.]
MQIIRRLSDLNPALLPWREAGEIIALVPTMGALHAGHMALVEAAKAEADRVVASIFVNPLQFNDPGDLARYPRQEEADAVKLEEAGCDLLWLPTADQLYPDGFATTVSVAGVSDRWEGKHRPGHFDGVATVVSKLFIATGPDIAIFGEKDWQQLAVIRRMTADLGLPIKIIGHPTIREDDGLAMSSRNVLLSTDERERASVLPEALETARDLIVAGGAVGTSLDVAAALLEAADFKIDYLALVDAATLEPLDAPSGEMRLIAAAVIGTTRLIDNIPV